MPDAAPHTAPDRAPDTADTPVRPDGPTVILPHGVHRPDGARPPAPSRAEHPDADTPVRPDGPTAVLPHSVLRPRAEHPGHDTPEPPAARPDDPTMTLPPGHRPPPEEFPQAGAPGTFGEPHHTGAPAAAAPPHSWPDPPPAHEYWRRDDPAALPQDPVHGFTESSQPSYAESPQPSYAESAPPSYAEPSHAAAPNPAGPFHPEPPQMDAPNPVRPRHAEPAQGDAPHPERSFRAEFSSADALDPSVPIPSRFSVAEGPEPASPSTGGHPWAGVPEPSVPPSQGEFAPPCAPEASPPSTGEPYAAGLPEPAWGAQDDVLRPSVPRAAEPLALPLPEFPQAAGYPWATVPPHEEERRPQPTAPAENETGWPNTPGAATSSHDGLPPLGVSNPAGLSPGEPSWADAPDPHRPEAAAPLHGEAPWTGVPIPGVPRDESQQADGGVPRRTGDPLRGEVPWTEVPVPGVPRDDVQQADEDAPLSREVPWAAAPVPGLSGDEVHPAVEAVPEDDSDAAAMARGERLWVKVPMPTTPPQDEAVAGAAAKPPKGGLSRSPSAREAEGEAEGPAGIRDVAATLAALAVIVVAVPAAVLVLPDTSANVVDQAGRALGLAPDEYGGLLRATGLSVPVLLGAVPVGAVAARRLGARPTLFAGVALLLAGLLGVARADTVPLVGAVRAAQGMGAGLILPATLVLAWERGGRLASALWSGVLVASLLGAMPLALARVPLPDGGSAPRHVTDWHASLAPFPWAAVAVACVLPFCLLLRGRRGRLPASRHTERGQLVLPLAPAAGFAFIAVVTTYGWSPGGRLVLAGLALLGLAGLAFVGSRDATAGSPLGAAVVMVTTGLLAYPVAAPLAGITAVAARNGDGTSGAMYLPFAAGTASALVAALIAAWLPRRAARVAVLAAHALLVLATLPPLLASVAHVPDSAHIPAVATASMIALGAGAGLALAVSLREAGVAGALFGLSLCFPAVLTGQLVVLSLQAGWLQPAPTTTAAQLVALTGGYRAWLGAAAVLTLLLAAAGRAATRGRPRPGGNRSRASASVQ
ncbi:hypothetical protein EBO15_08690 [Actinomadura harenae]|uniref:Uncharacterized protein n=1 Tax=Actinomadura harenae TaxID=2483351 RepID=A0A3M2M929_9ACTN|nr:hypothetical protein EBO15_08690 [Actinomadura harenae]